MYQGGFQSEKVFSFTDPITNYSFFRCIQCYIGCNNAENNLNLNINTQQSEPKNRIVYRVVS